MITIKINIDDHLWEEDFPGVDTVELECEFYYEPADPSVGIMTGGAVLEQVTRTDTQEQLRWDDLENWDRVEQRFQEAFHNHVEEQKTEAAIAAYENRQAYHNRF